MQIKQMINNEVDQQKIGTFNSNIVKFSLISILKKSFNNKLASQKIF